MMKLWVALPAWVYIQTVYQRLSRFNHHFMVELRVPRPAPASRTGLAPRKPRSMRSISSNMAWSFGDG